MDKSPNKCVWYRVCNILLWVHLVPGGLWQTLPYILLVFFFYRTNVYWNSFSSSSWTLPRSAYRSSVYTELLLPKKTVRSLSRWTNWNKNRLKEIFFLNWKKSVYIVYTLHFASGRAITKRRRSRFCFFRELNRS